MISDDITLRIASLQQLQRRVSRVNQYEQQKSIDERFAWVVSKTDDTLREMEFVATSLHGRLSDNIRRKTSDLVSVLSRATRSGPVSSNSIENALALYNEITKMMTVEWKAIYKEQTKNCLGTLNVVQRIRPEQALKYKADIEASEKWGCGMRALGKMKKALDDTNVIIRDLHLDDNVLQFLDKMNNGRATLGDLSEDLMGWLKEENLTGRVKLSF